MAEEPQNREDQEPPLPVEGRIPLLHGPLTPEEVRIQRQSEKEKAEKNAESEYKNRQIAIAESNVKLSTTNLRITGVLVFFTLVNAGFAGWQAWESRKSANAAKSAADTASDQFKLSRQQTEYLQKARVSMGGSIRYSKDATALESINLQLINNGKEKASELRAIFHLTERSVGSGEITRNYSTFPITAPYPLDSMSEGNALQYGNIDSRNLTRTWTLNVPSQKMSHVWKIERFLQLDMSIHYFDGFEDVNQVLSYCYLTYWDLSWVGDGPMQPFFPCEDFQPMLAEIRRNAEVEKTYHQTWPGQLRK